MFTIIRARANPAVIQGRDTRSAALQNHHKYGRTSYDTSAFKVAGDLDDVGNLFEVDQFMIGHAPGVRQDRLHP